MQNFESTIYQVVDFIRWHRSEELLLSPKFQRNLVWTESAKSYFIDTILRGLPTAKIFLRNIIDTKKITNVREVVDGQQRLNAIIEFVNGDFRISKSHNHELAGATFETLDQFKPGSKESFLQYGLSVDVLSANDKDIIDIFTRLNANSFNLNQMEKINSKYFNDFRYVVDEISKERTNYWVINNIFTTNQIYRMASNKFVADLLSSVMDGISATGALEKTYKEYETKSLPITREELVSRFNTVIDFLDQATDNNIREFSLRRAPVLYSILLALWHLIYTTENKFVISANLDWKTKVKYRLSLLNQMIENEIKLESENKDFKDFLKSIHLATTDKAVKTTRTKFIIDFLCAN